MAKHYVSTPAVPRFHLLVIERDDVVLYSRHLDAPGPYTYRRRIVSAAQLTAETTPADVVRMSPSLQSPREFTRFARTIHLCQQLRGGLR